MLTCTSAVTRNEGKQWDRNPQIQAFMKEKGIKDNHALQAFFNQRVLKILQKHGKKMIGWKKYCIPICRRMP